jgi:hypothetical protein
MPDLIFVARRFRSSHTMLIDISCLSGRISHGASTLAKVSLDKKAKYCKLAQETSNIREVRVEIIPIIVSSLGAVPARSTEALRNLLSCNDKAVKKIGRWPSEAAIMRSMEIERRYARDLPRTADARATRTSTQEVMIANDRQVNEQTEEDQEDQESGNRQANTTDEGSEDQRNIDLRDEIDTEPSEGEEADDDYCKEKERAMQEAIQETPLSDQDTSDIGEISDFI